MDRRFFTWLMLTTALCFFYLSIRQQQQPPQQPAAVKPAPNADPLLREPGEIAPEVPLAEATKDDAGADGNEPDAEIAALETPELPDNPARLITLGSMDPAKGFNLQVSLTTRGAGVEQAELVGRTKSGRLKFRALEHDGGYIGYLGAMEVANGVRIRTVPDGSPAALARPLGGAAAVGLEVGDTIVELNGLPVANRYALEEILSSTKPGQEIELSVLRGVAPNQKTLPYAVTLSEAPLDVLRMFPGQAETVAGNLPRPSLLTSLGSIDGTAIPVGDLSLPALRGVFDVDWQAEELQVDGGQGVEFRLPLDSFLAETGRPSELDLVKRYRLYPADEARDGYLLDLETLIVNRGDKSVNVSFRQEGPTGMTLEGWWYTVKISQKWLGGAGQRDVIYSPESLAGGHLVATTREVVDRARDTSEGQPLRLGGVTPTPLGMPKILLSENEPAEARQLDFIGLDAPYFAAALLPHPQTPTSLTDLRGAGAYSVAVPLEINKSQLQATNTSFWLDTREQALPAGGQLTQRYQVYIGPKDTDLLTAHGLESAIEYGWFPWIAKPLSAILHFFHWIVGNYGIAIVMLTVCVRGAMFPLGRKAAMNAQRMQELQPELKRINDLYKDNMEKRAKAMQELYAKHNFKPLAGCLPMFIQLPIFIGLYRCLSVDISLRQEPLIPGIDWASNLAAPDMLINWSGWMPEFIAGRGTGWLGPYFNILPMVTVGLFLLQQKMLMPKATDEQTRMTQNMMQVMTIFMGVLFFKVPSGLCIYFVTSSLWSLVERKLVKRFTPPSKPLTGGSDDTKGGGGGGSSEPPTRTNPKDRRKGQDASQGKPVGRFQELVHMLEKPAVKSTTQRGSNKSKKRKR